MMLAFGSASVAAVLRPLLLPVRAIAMAAVAALVLALVPSVASAQVQVFDEVEDDHGAHDVRDAQRALVPTSAQLAAVEELGATARWTRFGTAQSLIRHGDYLATDIEADDAASAALAWLGDNRVLFRLGALDSVEVDRTLPLTDDAYVVVVRQRIGDVPLSPDGSASIGLAGSPEGGWRVAYASSTLTGDTPLRGSTDLTLIQGWVAAAEAVGSEVDEQDVEVVGQRKGWTVLEVDGLEEEQLVRRIFFPTPRRGNLPAYEAIVVDVEEHGIDSGDRVMVDATDGDLLYQQGIVNHADDDPEWQVFPAYPPHTPLNRHPWNYPNADTRDRWCWAALPSCRLALAGSSPHPAFPWDVDASTGTPTFTTTGNYATSAENWFNFLFPGPTGYQPTSPSRTYVYPWQNTWFREQCDPAVFVEGSGNDIDAATVNLFAMHSRFHNWSYHLGFTEAAWNGQDHNFGVADATAEGDPLIGMVQAGAVSHGPPTYAGRNNAFMRTLPDGTPSQSAMFLWQPIPGAFYAPCVDGDFDMAVIGHEYTHMIENRMIGKGTHRTGFHAGAMGESVSDFIAMEYLNQYGFVPGGEAGWAVGPYVTGNTLRAIRNYNMAFASAGHFPEAGRYRRVNPLNLSNVGYDLVGPQVHADGEIWSATNYDLRELFAARYGGNPTVQRACADGRRPVHQCPGNRRWVQLVFDAFLLMPTSPTFLDARDAYLAADLLRFGGANQDLLWLGFARRGFGEHAAVTGTQDTNPVPSWESPLHEEATLVFQAEAKDEGGAPITDANIYVGHYEGRVTPAATTAAGNNELAVVPTTSGGRHRTIDFVAQADGYGHVRFRLSGLRAGETRNVTIRFPSNVASVHQGTVASGDGVNHEQLIDDTEATNWGSAGTPVQGRQVLLELAEQSTFDRAKVSAYLQPGQNRFTALRAFELLACTASGAQSCDPDDHAAWELVHRSAGDAFPGDNPRPVAPHLNLRTFEFSPATATHVLFRVLDNQCTGQTSFQGKQDRDPRHETDCRIGTPLLARDTEVFAAEIQLQTSQPEVVGARDAE
jgi:extracellular elastinolytic metalloproteinase